MARGDIKTGLVTGGSGAPVAVVPPSGEKWLITGVGSLATTAGPPETLNMHLYLRNAAGTSRALVIKNPEVGRLNMPMKLFIDENFYIEFDSDTSPTTFFYSAIQL